MTGIYGACAEDRYFESMLKNHLSDDDDAIREDLEKRIAKLELEIEETAIPAEDLDSYYPEEIESTDRIIAELRAQIQALEVELEAL